MQVDLPNGMLVQINLPIEMLSQQNTDWFVNRNTLPNEMQISLQSQHKYANQNADQSANRIADQFVVLIFATP